MKSQLEGETNAVKPLHPEDIVVGDFVVQTRITYQYPSFYWCGVDTVVLPPDELVHLSYLASDREPLIVVAVCLPFVLCKQIDDRHEMLDVRQVQFARLDPSFATLAWKALGDNATNTDKRDRKKAKKKKKRKSK